MHVVQIVTGPHQKKSCGTVWHAELNSTFLRILGAALTANINTKKSIVLVRKEDVGFQRI